ncbi:hypothetical protein O181_046493 [Austropuccinia psidii MF-1]|uniref:Reverse transcriptase Ty1/copia-type domain-containing protein n=1 Tax=Austropuccinia psidii MF-1 TaxID=1389203 RepID=A0A9Q3DSE5_9BASI|nr:hypothetical protein [Austropuccinia psidii MF-1]
MKDYYDKSIENDSPTVHAAFQGNHSMQDIIVDSGCSHHMTHNSSYLHQYENLETTIQVANGESVKVTGKGILHLVLKGKTIPLQCLHVPLLTSTLISIGRLCKKGYVFNASYNDFQIYYNGKIQMKGQIGQNGIFYLNSQIFSTPMKITTNMSIATDIDLLHARAGHPGLESLQHMFQFTNKASTFDLFPLPTGENSLNETQVSPTNSLEQIQVLPSSPSHENNTEACSTTTSSRQVVSRTSSGRPGWDIVHAPVGQKAPKGVSSDINLDNVITGKRSRRGNALHVVDELTKIPYDTTTAISSVPIVSSLNIPPKTYRQALAAVVADAWIQAIQAKKMALERKNVWEVVKIPSQAHLINSVWVFKRVFDGEGKLIKHKARLCAQGCAQIEGIEYDETYAPTGAMVTLRLLLTIGISNGWEVHQMDAKTAFLNSNIDEVIYLRSPLGLQLGPGKWYCLKKSIYGLKQSPRCWYKELVSFFQKENFSVSLTDSCLFISNNK